MVPVRAEERDVWAKAQRAFDHYKLAWAFWIAFFSALAWGIVHIKEPLEAVPILQAQNRQIIQRLDVADQDRKDMSQLLKTFGRILCPMVTANDRYKYDIDCSKLPAPEPTQKNPGVR